MEYDKKNSINKYGEEIPTLNKWISLDKQKERAKYIANLGKIKESNKKNNYIN